MNNFLLGVIMAALITLAGCSAAPTPPPATIPVTMIVPATVASPTSVVAPPLTGTVPPPPATVVQTVTVAPTPGPGMYMNPVLDVDFPDPDVLKVGDEYYGYATNGNGHNIQVARSKDLTKWDRLSDALPTLPEWAVQSFGWAWAPEIWQPQPGGPFVMYHVARFAIGKAGGTQCIGVAVSDRPQGPFKPVGDGPLVCQVGEGGSIDPATYVDDDGKPYLLWKNDGNSGGGQTWLYIQHLSADGMSLIGEPARLLTADQAWEGVLVEAPTLWKQKGKYYLFYSANAFNTPRYATGYAVSDKLLGPYKKAPQPLLKTHVGNGVVGPGGQDVVTGPNGDTWILFHGWSGAGYRRMYLGRLEWQSGAPVVTGLERVPQPGPALVPVP